MNRLNLNFYPKFIISLRVYKLNHYTDKVFIDNNLSLN